MNSLLLFCWIVLCGSSLTASAYTFYHMPSAPTKQCSLQMKRGRGSFKRELDGDSSGVGSQSSSMRGENARGGINWLPLSVSASALPQKDGEIGLIDTNLFTLKQGATNPTGAVAVVRQSGQVYCFASSCPSCKIPLTKSKIIMNDSKKPILSCSFCKTSYQLRSGEKTAAVEKGGIFSGVVKSIFSSKDSGPLPIYKLAEKNGKLLIALE